jgi:hypothetical protein
MSNLARFPPSPQLGTPVRYEFDSSAVAEGPMKLGGGMVETFSYGAREPRQSDHLTMRSLQRRVRQDTMTSQRAGSVTSQLTRVLSRTRSQRQVSRSRKPKLKHRMRASQGGGGGGQL